MQGMREIACLFLIQIPTILVGAEQKNEKYNGIVNENKRRISK